MKGLEKLNFFKKGYNVLLTLLDKKAVRIKRTALLNQNQK